MVGSCRNEEEEAVEGSNRQACELREKARLTKHFAPKLSEGSGARAAATPTRPRQRPRIPYDPPARRVTPQPNHTKVDDAASIQEVQSKGRKIRELLRINASPSLANNSRTATPVKGRQAQSDLLLRTPVSSSRGGDADKWSNQVSSRSSDASTVAPSQTSARSLRFTPAPSPQSSARSLKTSVAGTPPPSGRPPRAPKVKVDGPPKPSEKSGPRSRPRAIEPVPSSVLLLPERLAEAARRGDVELTRQCISELPAGAPVCEKDSYGWSSLHYAASGGHFEVCQLLLEAQGDANAELPDFSTPIMLAVEEGDIPVAKLLLQHGARTRSKDEAGFTVFDRCAPAALEEFTSCVQKYL